MAIQYPLAYPNQYFPEKNWESGLCGCCEDTSSCCCAFWCFPCFTCSTSEQFGTGYCLPLVDYLSPSAMSYCGIPAVVPPVTLSLRVAMRYQYKIKGSICDDIAVSLCCMCCSWCQMAREIKKHKSSTVMIVQSQPAPATNIQIHQQSAFQAGAQPQPPAYPQVATGLVAQAV